MRTYDELFRAAMSLRYRLLAEERDPRGSVFVVTKDEHCLLRMQPWGGPAVDHINERFCGFKLQSF